MLIGANYLGQDRCEFRVWAPQRQQVAVKLLPPIERIVSLTQEPGGYWQATISPVPPGTLYELLLDGELSCPDPASRYQPRGVHGPSQVVSAAAYTWGDDQWTGCKLQDYVIYELHVGAFTPAGTFDAVIPRLPILQALGVTAIELMPVAQFPGDSVTPETVAYRNWGYDGVYPFAVQHGYGGPDGLKRLVDACHQQGLAVILDVVYNHFGPEGNYTANFGPYVTHRYTTPWGAGINFDDAYSDGVRQFVIDNSVMWFQDYHMDALRLDAIHAIYDFSATHILAEMKAAVAAVEADRGYPGYLIAESDLNDVRVLTPPDRGGHGLDAQWSDDFHHCLHTLLTGEQLGYYEDFGEPAQLVKALQKGYVYDGIYSSHRKRRHGNDASDRPPHQFVVCAQNHDQVGNRMLGERLSTLVSFEALKLAAGAVLLSPYIPLLFMGEEYGETAPFLYFISHGDRDLVAAVREGRRREFAAFHDLGEPPDAASLDTFRQSQLNWELHQQAHHQILWRFYQTLLHLRRQTPALAHLNRETMDVSSPGAPGLICWQRWHGLSNVLCLMNFLPDPVDYQPGLDNRWQERLNSADTTWMGPGRQSAGQLTPTTTVSLPPHSFILYEQLEAATT